MKINQNKKKLDINEMMNWQNYLNDHRYYRVDYKCRFRTVCFCPDPALHCCLPTFLLALLDNTAFIKHVIFSSSQIGRFGISQREIGVSDREIFVR